MGSQFPLLLQTGFGHLDLISATHIMQKLKDKTEDKFDAHSSDKKLMIWCKKGGDSEKTVWHQVWHTKCWFGWVSLT